MTIEDPAWFAWLDAVSSFAFHGQSGSFTARKETKQRGAEYWYAYRKREGTLAKKYLGKTADLTFARLEDVAGVLHADRATAARTPSPPPPAPHERFSHTRTRMQCCGYSLILTPHAPPNTQGDRSPLCDQAAPAPSPRAARVPLPPRRATPAGSGRRAHARLGPRRFWENDPACPMAGFHARARRLALA